MFGLAGSVPGFEHTKSYHDHQVSILFKKVLFMTFFHYFLYSVSCPPYKWHMSNQICDVCVVYVDLMIASIACIDILMFYQYVKCCESHVTCIPGGAWEETGRAAGGLKWTDGPYMVPMIHTEIRSLWFWFYLSLDSTLFYSTLFHSLLSITFMFERVSVSWYDLYASQ